MIPLHRPPFGLGTILRASVWPAHPLGVLAFEEAFAQATGVEQAVWLPSARAGICWALRAALSPGTQVLAPAFTCSVVHEAIFRAGGQLYVLDAAPDDFLVPESSFTSTQGRHALVLCEVYGHQYDLAALTSKASTPPLLRVIDMAMAIPGPDVGRRLEGNDFAVISFGTGKSMYAGFGAIGFTRDAVLASEVRKLRDSAVGHATFQLFARRFVEIAGRTAAHYPLLYSLAHKLKPRRLGGEARPAERQSFPADWSQKPSEEWRLASTRLDRELAFWNLDHAQHSGQTRLELARKYHVNLESAPGIMRPKPSSSALSHYTVRLPREIRGRVMKGLYGAGIYTITLWRFLPHLDPGAFPHAARLSASVLNLPLSPWLTTGQVDQVCEALMACVQAS